MSMPTAPRRRRLCRPWVSWNGKWRGEEGSKSVWLGWKHGHFFGLPLHFQCVPVLHTQPVHWVRYYRWDLYGEKLVQPLKNETLPSPVVIWHIYIYMYTIIYIYIIIIYIYMKEYSSYSPFKKRNLGNLIPKSGSFPHRSRPWKKLCF